MNTRKILLVAIFAAAAFVTKAQSKQEPSHQKTISKNLNQPADLSAFLKRNPTVANVQWKSNKKIIISLDNRQVQTYNLDNSPERKTFENKFGKPPTAPPPPPPVKIKQAK